MYGLCNPKKYQPTCTTNYILPLNITVYFNSELLCNWNDLKNRTNMFHQTNKVKKVAADMTGTINTILVRNSINYMFWPISHHQTILHIMLLKCHHLHWPMFSDLNLYV